MARINIEDKLHAEKEFKRLVRLIGDEDKAIGLLYRFWREAQDLWGDECKLMSKSDFLADGFQPILEAGLAEEREGGIYARGSETRFAWYLGKVRGGKARAQAQRDNAGHFVQQQTSTTPAEAQQTQVEHQPPAPVPVPVPKKENTEETPKKTGRKRRAGIDYEYTEDFEECWNLYGGVGKKKAAFDSFEELNLSPDQLAQLKSAIGNYLGELRRKGKLEYQQHFATFLHDDWRVHLAKSQPQVAIFVDSTEQGGA